jgi:hypothetical protein
MQKEVKITKIHFPLSKNHNLCFFLFLLEKDEFM